MKKKSLLTIALSIILVSVHAEIIKGPAKLCVKPGGTAVVSLKDGLDVECGQIENGWFEISVSIKLTKSQYEKHLPIKKGDKLLDFENREIGIAMADIPTSSTAPSMSGGAPGNPASYWMDIIGYVERSGIAASSIPENSLNEIIAQYRSDLKYNALEPFMLLNKFEDIELLKKFYPNLKEYYISEAAIGGGSAIDRIRLIFEQGILMAVVHSRPLKIANVKEYDILYGNKIIVFRVPAGVDINTFIKKNKEAYRGVN